MPGSRQISAIQRIEQAVRLAQPQRRGDAQIGTEPVGDDLRTGRRVGVTVLERHARDHARRPPPATHEARHRLRIGACPSSPLDYPHPDRLMAAQALSRAAGAPLLDRQRGRTADRCGRALRSAGWRPSAAHASACCWRTTSSATTASAARFRDALVERAPGRRVRRRGVRLGRLPGPVARRILEAAARGRRPSARVQSAAAGQAVRLDQPRPSQGAGGRWRAGLPLRRLHQREMAGRPGARRTALARYRRGAARARPWPRSRTPSRSSWASMRPCPARVGRPDAPASGRARSRCG